MPRSDEFFMASCQAILFTPDEEVSPAKIISGLLPGWTSRFDGEPVVLPFPGGVPREIPRVILESRTGTWRCEIASSRISVFWRRTTEENTAPSLAEFFEEASQRLIEYQDFQRSRVGRIAAVLNRFSRVDSPGPYLARHFCQERWLTAPLNRPEAFELHAHKKYEWSGFRVNSWVRNKTAELDSPGAESRQPIILVEQDINTLPEDEPKAAYNPPEIRRFFSLIGEEFDHILKLYHPSEE